MLQRTSETRCVPRWRLIAAALLPLGLGTSASWTGAFATYTSSVQASAAFNTGTIDLTANGAQGPIYNWTSLTLGNVGPGQANYALLTLGNAGTAGLTYTMSTTATGSTALGAALTVGVREIASTGCDSVSFGTGSVVVPDGTALSSVVIGSRPIAPAGISRLCFKVTLPASAPSSLQGAAVTPSFAVVASS